MLKVMFLERVISFENSFNGILAAAHQIPLIRRMISEEAYERNAAKRVLMYVNFILGLFAGFVCKLLYAVIFLLVPYIIMRKFAPGNEFNYEETVVNIFIMMNCICGSLIYTGLLSESEEDYMLINVMRIDPVKHYHGRLFFKVVTDVVFFFLILLMFGLDAGVCLELSFLLAASRGMGEFLRLLIYDRLPFLYERIVTFDVFVIVACVYFAYAAPCYKGYMPGLDMFALSSSGFMILFAAGTVCLCLVWFYGKYDNLARKKIRYIDVEHAEQVAARARIKSVRTEVSSLSSIGKHDVKKGYFYINSIFFDRYKKIIRKIMLNRVSVVILVCVVVSVFVYRGDEHVKFVAWENIKRLSAQPVIVAFFLSSGLKVCKTVYFNCDRTMLNFSYYRTERALVDNFKFRLGKIMLIDLNTALCLCISLVVTVYCSGHIHNLSEIIPVLAELLALGILTAIYNTAIYHVLQPYNELLKIKVPLFNLCNAIMIIIALALNLLKLSVVSMLVITVLADIFAFFGAFILIKRYGEENYKNKQ